jgi:hypothetical protein
VWAGDWVWRVPLKWIDDKGLEDSDHRKLEQSCLTLSLNYWFFKNFLMENFPLLRVSEYSLILLSTNLNNSDTKEDIAL